MERIVQFDSGGLLLHGILHEPDAGCGRCILICDPFAEEKKCAHRPLVDMARALCADGYVVLRFDYRGCGNSPGNFVDHGPSDWEEDIHRATGFLRAESGVDWVGLAGLRLGATLALRAASAMSDIAAVILWEPILDGQTYVRQNLRRSMIKAMLTDGQKFDADAVAAKHQSEVVDFDGYEISARAMGELQALKPPDTPFPGHALVLNIGPRDEPSPDMTRLAESLPAGSAFGIRLEPFWNRIGLVDTQPLADLTLGWLGSCSPDRGEHA
ncbi:MAG: alpha/beta fold hydrolase [Armatimonadetes bacterium]|jgi:alpha/beta superfamily hydrolase|nr:alpha/beta fold hydrolase [Armatimonadota bacterium]MDI9586426.1 alpha/beta fold hydrolase [Acidobacteriota bacterium]